MAIVMTKRAQAAKVRRTYNCGDCGLRWQVIHDHMDEPIPDCPTCLMKAQWEAPLPALLTTKSLAVDMAQRMAEEDFGLTNMHDNSRPGDVAYMGPSPMQTAERDALTQQMAEMARSVENEGGAVAPEVKMAMGEGNFWTAGQAAMPNMGNMIAQASPAVAQQQQEGTAATSLLEKARSEGMLRPMNAVVGRYDPKPAPAA